jgi:ParB family transcriptional regulator, chromosome partitioning protein
MANLLARREPTSMQRQAKELVTKVGEADPNGRQQRIPIASIRPNPNQPRKNVDHTKIVALAENIRRVGVINPVTVVYRDGGEYELRAGQRRLLAHQHLGETTILARVFLTSDPAVAIAENLLREDLDVVETALAIRDMMEQMGVEDQSQIADLVGMERSRISRFLGVLRMPQDILDEYRDMADEISATRLFEVASGGTDERQRKLWALAKAGLTERELRDAKRSEVEAEAEVEGQAGVEGGEGEAGGSGRARPRERTVRPLKAGKQLLDMIERLSVTMDHLDGTGAQVDEDHRSKLEMLRKRIDQVLEG